MQPDSLFPRMEIAALFVAYLALFALATVPLVNVLVAPFVPIPLCAVLLRHGWGAGILCAGGLLLILAAAASAPEQLYCLPFATAAILLGGLARRAVPAGRIVFAGAAGMTLLLLCLFYGYNVYAIRSTRVPTTAAYIDGLYDPDRLVGALTQQPDSSASRALDTLFSMATGDSVSAAALKVQTSQEYTDFLKRNEESRQFLQKVNRFPLGVFFVGSFVYFCIFYATASWVLLRLGLRLPTFEGFATWRIPWPIAWAPLTCFASLSMCTVADWPMGEFAFASLLFVTLVPYMALAFAIASFWVERSRLDPLLAAVIYSFLVFNLRAMAVAAIFDAWFDYRRLEQPEKPAGGEDQKPDIDDDIEF